MKKLVALMLVVVLAFTGFITWKSYQPVGDMAVTDGSVAAYDPAMSEEAAEAVVRSLDYEAIKALYDDDMVVMSIHDRDISWKEYYGWLYMNAKQVESYFEQMAQYYGVAADWTGSVGDGSGTTYAQMPVSYAEESLLQLASIEKMAAEKDVVLSADSAASLEPEAIAAGVLGEGSTVEELEAALAESFMDVDTYKAIFSANLLFSDIIKAQYGEDYENVKDEAVAAWLSDAGYLRANHILFMTMDKDTGDKLDEAAAADKKALADEVYAELAAIEDTEELVKRFKQLKEQYDEDTGKTYYPDGYTFTPGTMVAEFEDSVNSMEDYGLSQPVETSYGWHVILRLPLSGDCTLSDGSGSMVLAREQYALAEINQELSAYLNAEAIVYAEGFEKINLTDYIK